MLRSYLNWHLIVVEGFEYPNDPRSYVVWGLMPLVGSPKANRSCSGRFLFQCFKSHLNDTSLTGDLTRVHFHSLNNSITHRSAVDVPFIVASEDSIIQHQEKLIPWFMISISRSKNILRPARLNLNKAKRCPAHLGWLTCITRTPPMTKHPPDRYR